MLMVSIGRIDSRGAEVPGEVEVDRVTRVVTASRVTSRAGVTIEARTGTDVAGHGQGPLSGRMAEVVVGDRMSAGHQSVVAVLRC
jgi:hypothetical protein